MPNALESKITQRAQAWERLSALRATIGTRPATPAQRATWDQIERDLVNLGAEIDRMRGIKVPAPRAGETAEETRYAAAFDGYLRKGAEEMRDEDRQVLTDKRAQAEGTGAAGGYLVPQGYWAKITETLKAFGGLLGLANVITTSTGNPLPWPSNNDTGNVGGLLSENVQITEIDLALGTKQLSAYTYTSGALLASLQLLQDSAFDLETWLPKKIGERIGRAVADAFVNGTGTGQPKGILGGVRTGVAAATGATASITYNSLIDLEHSVDPAYRQGGNCKWLMHDYTLGAIRKITDTNGRPLWTPGYGSFDQSNPEAILGYPVVIDNAMPPMQPSAKSVLFGDFRAGYVVRQVLDPTILNLRERYADFLQVGWIGFCRFDGSPDDEQAIASYVNSAA